MIQDFHKEKVQCFFSTSFLRDAGKMTYLSFFSVSYIPEGKTFPSSFSIVKCRERNKFFNFSLYFACF